MRKILKRWAGEFARDEGVAGLIIAMIIAILSATAFAVFFRNATGPARQLARLQETLAAGERVQAAVLVSYYAQTTAPRRIVCPDTNFDGDAEASCGTSGTATGTLPWRTLGISEDDARDGYGRYYTYVVAASPETRELCVSVGNDYDTSAAREYTGALVEGGALEVRTTSQSAGQGRYVPFALISHGANGYGARVSASVTMSTASAGASEVINATNNTTTVISGPHVDGSSGSAGFDDVVYAPSNSAILNACESLTPAEVANGSLSEDFTGTSGVIDTTKFSTTGSTSPPTVVTTAGDGVARFSNATSYLATAASYDFTPSVRPVYVSAYWTPANAAGQFSIATRATLPPAAGDDFGVGVTFRFSASGIAIREDSATLNTPAAFTIVAGQKYHLEVYDNGDDVWARITRVSSPSASATASASTTDDLSGDQRVVFVNGSTQSDLDDILIGVPMLAAEFNGTSSVAAAAANTNMFTAATPSVTVEAWVYPETYPADDGVPGTIDAAVIAGKWNGVEATSAASQGFRLYLNSGEVHLQLAGAPGGGSQTIETFDAGFSPSLNTWTHVAASYDASTGAIRFYKDGELVSSSTSTITGTGTTGVNDSTTLPFAVGADRDGAGFADYFDGRISDVRVWETARTQNEIRSNYNKRIAANTTDLVVNWRLDPTPSQGGLFAGATVAATTGTGGTGTNVAYGGTLSRYFRPNSSEFCPSGTKVFAYQCDFRTVAMSTTDDPMENPLSVPGDLTSLYVKAWGGGGGGYDVGSDESSGGAGGFSAALLESIDGAPISGAQLDVVVGGGGTGSTNSSRGAGGGGASGVMIGSDLGLVAGGGGGASFSDQSSFIELIIIGLLPVNCDDVEDTSTQCGIAGGGGGAGVSANAGDATDNTPGRVCGGRGGNSASFGSDPPGNVCSGGGANPSGSTGGNGGGTNDGGVSAIGAGGDGYDASTRGGGGGGGGAAGGEAGGYAVSANSGFGGGGGSGSADSTGSFFVRGEASTFTLGSSTCSGGSITGTLDNGSNVITNIDAPSTWYVGCDIEGNYTNNNATITAINRTARTVTMSHNSTGGGGVATDLSAAGTSTPTGVFTSGGSSDDDYAPSYATATNPSPGRGGDTTTVNGYSGAVVLKW